MDKQRNLKAIFLDFDGTITNLDIDYNEVRLSLKSFFLNNYNLKSEFKPLLGEIKNLANLSGDEHSLEKSLEIINAFEIKAAQKAVPFKGVKEIFELCHSTSTKIAIITRNSKICVETFSNRFPFFIYDTVVARDDAQRLKPHPEQALLALDRLNIKNDNCLLVGDTFHDKELGENAKIQTYIINKNNSIFYIFNNVIRKELA